MPITLLQPNPVQAAEKLDLPTEPVSAYLQSLDKHATRKLVSPDTQALRLDSVGQLDNLSMSQTFDPCITSWSSNRAEVAVREKLEK